MNGYSIENIETEAVTGHGGNKEIVTFHGPGMRIYYAFRENMIQEIWFPENSEN